MLTIGDEIKKVADRYEAKLAETRAAAATARDDALEEAARWHDKRATLIIHQTKMHDFDNGPAKVMSREDGSIAVAHHRQSAAAIRALKGKQP